MMVQFDLQGVGHRIELVVGQLWIQGLAGPQCIQGQVLHWGQVIMGQRVL